MKHGFEQFEFPAGSFDADLAALIKKHYPNVLRGEPDACGVLTCKLADCIGGVLAWAYLKGDGEKSAKEATELVGYRIVSGMMETIRLTMPPSNAKPH